MDCPNCHTWNPDDKTVCWRCQTELPKPVQKKPPRQSRTLFGLPAWTWALVVLMMVVWFVVQCQGVRLVGR